MYLAVGIGLLVFLGLAAVCFRRLKINLLQGGSCSAVISAACHGPEDNRAAFKGVRWGEVVDTPLSSLRLPIKSPSAPSSPQQLDAQMSDVDDTGPTSIRHCCLTSLESYSLRTGCGNAELR